MVLCLCCLVFALVPDCVISHAQNTLTKTLKSLEGRHLIKTAKSVKSKSKKLYMLYELSKCIARMLSNCHACTSQPRRP